MTEEKKISRRGYLKYVGAGVVVVAGAAAAGAYYATRPQAPTPTTVITTQAPTTVITTQAPVTRPYEGEEITIAMYPAPDTDAAKAMKADFERETGAKVTFKEIPYEAMYEKFVTVGEAKTGEIDIWEVVAHWALAFVNRGYLYPIDEFVANKSLGEAGLNDINPIIRDQYVVEDKLYALPVYPDMPTLFYRDDLISNEDIANKFKSKTGEDLKPPDTTNDLIKVSQFLTENKYVKYGLALQRFKDVSISQEFLNWLYGLGGDFLYGQKGAVLEYSKDQYLKPAFNDERGIAACQFMVDLDKKHKVLSPGTLGMSFFDAMEVFATGDSFAYLGYADVYGFFADPKTSKVAGKWGSAPWPILNSTTMEGRRAGHTGGWGLCVSNDSKYKECAYRFIEWVYGSEHAKLYAMLGGLNVHRPSIVGDPELQAKFPIFKTVSEMLPYVRYHVMVREWPEIYKNTDEELQEAMMERKTPKQALDDAAKVTEDILSRAGYYST